VKTKTYGDALFNKWRQVQRKRGNRDENLLFTVLSDFETNPWKAKIHFLSGKHALIEAQFEALPMPSRWAGENQAKPETPELKIAS
jgi:hypothetical protein